MPRAALVISDVRLTGTNTLVPGSVVGADPWNDADAATYTENTASYRTNASIADQGQTAVGDLAVPVEAATLTGVELEADFTSINTGASGARHAVSVTLHDSTGSRLTNFAVPTLTGGTMETVITSDTDLGSDPAVLSQFLLPYLDGGQVRVDRFSNADAGLPADITIRTHRLILWIDYEVGTTPALTVVRQYPRDDGRGLSSAPRLYPASKARRRVGGYQ